MSDEETFPPVRPDDPDEQRLYLGRLQRRYPEETARVAAARLGEMVREALELCPRLQISDPTEVERFLALTFLITAEQKKSALLGTVMRRILGAADVWSARKRLNFIYKHIIGRRPPNPEPDFGPWFVDARAP